MKLNPLIDAKQVADHAAINSENLNDDFVEISGLFFFYSSRYAKAEHQRLRAKQALDLLYAQLDSQIRETSEKKPSEAQIKSMITMEDSYQKALSTLNDAGLIADLAKGAVDSLKAKRDALIQLGANHREEVKGALRSRTPSDSAHDLAQNAARLAS